MIGQAKKEPPSFFETKKTGWWEANTEPEISEPAKPIMQPTAKVKDDDYVIDVKYRPKSSQRLMLVLAAAVLAYLAVNGRGAIDNWRYWYITEYRNTKIKTVSATDARAETFTINRIGINSPITKLDSAAPIIEQYKNSLVYYQSSAEQTVITAPARSSWLESAPLSLLNQAVVGDSISIKLNSKLTTYKVVKIIKTDSFPVGDLGDVVIVTNDYSGLSKNILIVVADKLLWVCSNVIDLEGPGRILNQYRGAIINKDIFRSVANFE